MSPSNTGDDRIASAGMIDLHIVPSLVIYIIFGTKKRDFPASLYELNFPRCYPIGRQQELFRMRTTYEEPTESAVAGQAGPRASML